MSSKALQSAGVSAPVVTDVRNGDGQPLRLASFVLVAANLFLVFALSAAFDIALEPTGSAPLACFFALLLLISVILGHRGRRARLADFFGTLGVTWLGALSGGGLALIGLHLKHPLADPYLRAADRALGVDGVSIVETMVEQGQWLFSIMAPAYAYTIPLLALAMAGLALFGKRSEAWRAAFCFNGTLLTASLIGAMMPAKGLGVWFSDQLIQHLPDRAARYFYPSFDHFYYDPSPRLGLDALDGVITFPSFHMIMGLIVLAMLRHHLILLLPVGAWFSVMVLSTLPFGGHYGVDLIGGLAVWASWFALSKRIEAGT